MTQRRRRGDLVLMPSQRRNAPRLASAQDVAELAQDWTDEILECRTYGHKWTPHRAQHVKQYRYFYVIQLCPRCLTTRHMEISEAGGEVFDTWYEYPDGYLTKGLGRITGDARGQLRLATVLRTFKIETVGVRKTRDMRKPHGHTRDAVGWTG
jgi:hypothetical protein